MTRTLEQSCLNFIKAAASDSHTPGGGSVSMNVAANGMALILMALKITRNKAEDKAALDHAIAKGEDILKRMIDAVERDIAAFDSLMKTYKLPKNTDDEKAARKTAIQSATIDATREPLAAARLCLDAVELARQTKPLVAAAVESDRQAGAIIAAAAGCAVLLNVDINLTSIHDTSLADSFAKDRRQIETALREPA